MIRPVSFLRALFLTAAIGLVAPATGMAVQSTWNPTERMSPEGNAGGQGGAVMTQSGRTAVVWLEQDGDGAATGTRR